MVLDLPEGEHDPEQEEAEAESEAAFDDENRTVTEVESQVSRGSRYSKVAPSEISRLSQKTYISHLEKELKAEKDAR